MQAGRFTCALTVHYRQAGLPKRSGALPLAKESQCGLHTAVAEFGHGCAGIGSACSMLSDGFARYACIILASAKHNVWESFVPAEGSAIDFPSLAPMFELRLVRTE
jgi:hypothetical protein